MEITIKYFGMLTEFVGNSEEIMSVEKNYSSDNLIQKLRGQYQFPEDISYKIAVNREVFTKNTKLNAGDEIALLPPFAGG